MKQIKFPVRKIFTAAAAALFGLSCLAASRTMTITEQTATSVTFTFGGDALACKLFVATGETDGGDDKAAWTTFEEVSEIKANQTTHTYEVSDEYRDGRKVRFFLMQTEGIDMASELKSVTSNGNQWLFTGVDHTTSTCVDFRFGKADMANDRVFFGRLWGNSSYLFLKQGNNFAFYGDPAVGTGVAVNKDLDYRLVIGANNVLKLTSLDGSTEYYHYHPMSDVDSGLDATQIGFCDGGA